MKRIRIAQIGINRYSHGYDIFLTLRSLPEIFEIAGYALVEDEKETCADKLSVFEGYNELSVEEILNDPSIEAVTIETDEIHLTKYALMAAKSGKHIHMEKPGSQSLPDFEELINTVKTGGKVFHVGYMYRYNPYVIDALKRVKSGELGEIFSVEAQMNGFVNKSTLRWLGNFQGGMMFYLGCHLVDLVLQLQGIPDSIIPLNCSTDPQGISTEDLSMAVLKYRNGVSLIKSCAVERGGFDRRQLVVCGTNGTLEIKPLEIAKGAVSGMNFAFRTARRECIGTKPTAEYTNDLFDRYTDMMKGFAEMVRGERENPYTYNYELLLFKTILKCCGADN